MCEGIVCVKKLSYVIFQSFFFQKGRAEEKQLPFPRNGDTTQHKLPTKNTPPKMASRRLDCQIKLGLIMMMSSPTT